MEGGREGGREGEREGGRKRGREEGREGEINHCSPSSPQHPDTGKLHNVSPTVSKDQSLEIYDPIKVEPHLIVVLWDPTSEYRYQHQMKVLLLPFAVFCCI